jgi:RNA polymerase sigma-70 factor, ECF subfamily
VVATTPESSTSLSPEAIQRLVDHHRQFLAFLQTRVESRAAAEDILQTAFVKGLERGCEVRDEESAVAWFYRVLRNAVIDHYRHRASTERAIEGWGNAGWGKEFVAHESPEDELKDEICQCVSGLLETLKPEYRDALRIVDLDEGSLNDLAEQAGITSGTLRSECIARARPCASRFVWSAEAVRSTGAWIVTASPRAPQVASRADPNSFSAPRRSRRRRFLSCRR